MYLGFDMLKIGIGPSSSHTLLPWRAGERFLLNCAQKTCFRLLTASKLTFTAPATGTGHATDLAVMLGTKWSRS
jgi:L-serine dehydratase